MMRPLPKRNSKKNNKPQQDASREAIGSVVQIPSKSAKAVMDKVVQKKTRGLRGLMMAGGALIFLATSGVLYAEFGLSASKMVEATRVTTALVSYDAFQETIPLNAVLIPEKTVFLDSVEGGRVLEVHIEDGAEVKTGTPLVTLKNTDLELQVIGREAQYTQQLSNLAQSQIAFDQSQLRYDRELMDAKLQIDLTRSSLQRRLPIAQTGVPQSEIDRLEAELSHQEAIHTLIQTAKKRDTANANRNLNQLKQSVGRMEDSVDIMRGSLDQLTLRAPIDGRVSALTLQSGQFLSPGSRIGQVDVLGSFKVRAYINEFYLNRLAIEQNATAIVAGNEYDLSVSKIYPTIANRQFEVDLLFNDAVPENLRRGQNVRIRIIMGDADEILTIPTGAFEAETGLKWVFVLAPDGKTAIRREIETGRKNPDGIEVLSGLSEGERIITSDYAVYGDSQTIKFTFEK